MTYGYQQTYQMRTGDFDVNSNLMPASVLDLFQDIAGVDANLTPCMSRTFMVENNMFWAVTRNYYEVVAQPSIHECVSVSTWPLAPTRLGIQRDYLIESLDGEVYVKGTSEWVAMSFDTRSFISAKQVFQAPLDFSTRTAFDKQPRRVRNFETDEAPHVFVPAYSDIDMNGHFNNTKYTSHVLDALDFKNGEEIRALQVDYRREIKRGVPVSLYLKRDGSTVLAKGMDSEDEVKPAFTLRMELK